jgi:hypothetical protein
MVAFEEVIVCCRKSISTVCALRESSQGIHRAFVDGVAFEVDLGR